MFRASSIVKEVRSHTADLYTTGRACIIKQTAGIPYLNHSTRFLLAGWKDLIPQNQKDLLIVSLPIVSAEFWTVDAGIF